MIKNILISSILGSASLTSLTSVNFSNVIKEHSDWNNADLSELAFDTKEGKAHSIDDWNSESGTDNDFNLSHDDISQISDKDEKSWQDKTKLKLAMALDKTLDISELRIFGKHNIFYNEAIESPDNIYISVEKQSKNSFEILNDPKDTFNEQELIKNGDINNLYLRVSNKSSTDWSENKSYFDVTVDIAYLNNSSYGEDYKKSTDWVFNENLTNDDTSYIVNRTDEDWKPFDTGYYPDDITKNADALAYFSNVLLSFDYEIIHTSDDQHSDFRNAWIGGNEGSDEYDKKGSKVLSFKNYTADSEKEIPMDAHKNVKNEAYYASSPSLFMDWEPPHNKLARCSLEEGVYINYDYNANESNSSEIEGLTFSPSLRLDEINAETNKLRDYRGRKFSEEVKITSVELIVSVDNSIFN